MTALLSQSPALVRMTIHGRNVPVCGRDMRTALWAAALVDVVTRRGQTIPLPQSRSGGMLRTRIDQASLARFLHAVYGDDPVAVAEALMSLRKFGRIHSAWLVHVLRKHVELAALDQAVRRHLSGIDG